MIYRASTRSTSSVIGLATLYARRYHGASARRLASISMPASCINGSTIGAVIALNADPHNATLQVTCNALHGGASQTTPSLGHGLDWQDENGAGDTTGEAVLRINSAHMNGTTVLGSLSFSLASVEVMNRLPSATAPAVLAPVTDQSGTISWDIGSMGRWHDRGQPGAAHGWNAGADDGVLDVTRPPFNADPSGNTDSTLALQAAIEFAMSNYMTVWLPVGVYKVTQGLVALQRERMSADGDQGFNGKCVEPAPGLRCCACTLRKNPTSSTHPSTYYFHVTSPRFCCCSQARPTTATDSGHPTSGARS